VDDVAHVHSSADASAFSRFGNPRALFPSTAGGTGAGSMNPRSPNRPYVIVSTRFPGGEPHTLRLKAL
jgi:hypothetical protein